MWAVGESILIAPVCAWGTQMAWSIMWSCCIISYLTQPITANLSMTRHSDLLVNMNWTGQTFWRRGWRQLGGGTILSGSVLRLQLNLRKSSNRNSWNSSDCTLAVISNRLHIFRLMESVSKARARLATYPLHLANCGPQAVAYGRCVGDLLGEVRKDQCGQQFKVFMQCIRQSAKTLGTKLWRRMSVPWPDWSSAAVLAWLEVFVSTNCFIFRFSVNH